MKTNAIRIMLDHLHEVAAKQGIDLLTNSAYCYINCVVTAHEQGEEITFPEKRECRDDLESLCFALGVNYNWLIHKALKEVGYYAE